MGDLLPNPCADCLGIVNDAREFALWVSPHILECVASVLVEPQGFKWDVNRTEEFVSVIVEITDALEGGVIEPDIRVTDCRDYEDNRILELALAASGPGSWSGGAGSAPLRA